MISICSQKNCTQMYHKNNLPNNQLKQEVPIFRSFKGSWQRGKLSYMHTDKYKTSKLSTCCNVVGLITLQCLIVIPPWEVTTEDTSLCQGLLLFK